MKKILLCCCLLSVSSCKKKPVAPKVESVLRILSGYGVVVGLGAAGTIGPEGGTLNLPKMMLRIPAGALLTPTGFTIKTISNTLPGSSAERAYRLSPNDIIFQKPIEIIYTYSTAELTGSSNGILYLANQDKDGYWNILDKTQMNLSAQTLTINTTRMGDWTIYPKH